MALAPCGSPPGPTQKWRYTPASGQLALSTGLVRGPKGEVIGRFNSIWQRQGNGRWLVIFDKGSPPEPGAK